MADIDVLVNLINITLFVLGVLIIAVMAIILNSIEKNSLKIIDALNKKREGNLSGTGSNCNIQHVSQQRELLLAFLNSVEYFDYVEIKKSNFAESVEEYLANNSG